MIAKKNRSITAKHFKPLTSIKEIRHKICLQKLVCIAIAANKVSISYATKLSYLNLFKRGKVRK